MSEPVIPIAEQIAELEREIKMRSVVYPQLVARSKLDAGAAERQSTRLRAALRTLLFVQKHADTIRARIT